jgi:MFS family permease
MGTFGIDEVQMGAVFTGALLVGAVLYPVWGYLYDRYSRSKLLALASFIWGSTTWLSAIAPTYPTFLATRASTGIDDSSYPGLFSLITDYFSPKMRGKIYGILQLANPLGYMIGLFAATILSGLMDWQAVFYITGSLGIVLGFVIFFGVKEPSRGQSEPELTGLGEIREYHFDINKAKDLFRKRSLILLFTQGFVGLFPWNVIVYWFFRYLETEREYSDNEILVTMAPAILVIAAGYFIGGALGDYFFRKTPRGRLLVGMFGVITGAIFLTLALLVPIDNKSLFLVFILATAVFMPFPSANVIATVYDITLPEVRSTALSIQYLIENIGAALAPLLAGLIARPYSLHIAILSICLSAWVLATIILGLTAYYVPVDIRTLRSQMQERSETEKALTAAENGAILS